MSVRCAENGPKTLRYNTSKITYSSNSSSVIVTTLSLSTKAERETFALLNVFFLSDKPQVNTRQAHLSNIWYAPIATNLGFLNLGPTMTLSYR